MIDFGDLANQMRQWRHQIHQHPETAYEEFETAKLVKTILQSYDIEVHENWATTGLVGVIKGRDSDRVVGLRADLDALDLDELNQFEHRSKINGKMHACGHDGHTSMLLGAACYLAQNRDFDGTVLVIFQPAEEVEGGAQKMIDEGLFERFPMDGVFGMHNYPTMAVGTFSICPGPMMAAFGSFECIIKGVGMHSSLPHMAVDPIEIGVEIHRQWKSILHRDIEPLQPAVISITQFNSGTAANISPETAVLKGSCRCFAPEVAKTIEKRMTDIANDVCAMNNARCEFIYKQSYPALVNEPVSTNFAADVAAGLVGDEMVFRDIEPILGSEDFACMLQHCPGAYILIGNGIGEDGGCMVHNPNYDFNDEILEVGASYWVNLATSFLRKPF
ncbi:MAG: amidohydrolase [Gammaproteobacteria bacterium]|nr:MAG: amidohydrolase [Gammaproteobacteria bacterium]